MNGRTYDPTLGRFLQADPHVQAPNNMQNYNRYSYVLNNPMSYTDPSGFFFDKMFKDLNKVLGDFAPIVSIAIGIMSAVTSHAILGAFFAGGFATGSLRGAIVGAISAGMYSAVGGAYGAGTWENVLGNGIVGGLSSEFGGGNFGHGFWAAGFSSVMKPGINKIGNGAEAFKALRIVAAAVIGGTASVISGGKFGNGAVTGAFSQAFNAEGQITEAKEAFMKETGVSRSQVEALLELGDSIYKLSQAAQNKKIFEDMIGGMGKKDLALLSRALGLGGDAMVDAGMSSSDPKHFFRVELNAFYRNKHFPVAIQNAANAAKATQNILYIDPLKNRVEKVTPNWLNRWYKAYEYEKTYGGRMIAILILLVTFSFQLAADSTSSCVLPIEDVIKSEEFAAFERHRKDGIEFFIPKTEVTLIQLSDPSDFLAVDSNSGEKAYSFMVVTNAKTKEDYKTLFNKLVSNTPIHCTETKGLASLLNLKSIDSMFFDKKNLLLKVIGDVEFYENRAVTKYVYSVSRDKIAVFTIFIE